MKLFRFSGYIFFLAIATTAILLPEGREVSESVLLMFFVAFMGFLFYELSLFEKERKLRSARRDIENAKNEPRKVRVRIYGFRENQYITEILLFPDGTMRSLPPPAGSLNSPYRPHRPLIHNEGGAFLGAPQWQKVGRSMKPTAITMLGNHYEISPSITFS